MNSAQQDYEKEFVRQTFNLTSTANRKKKIKKVKGNARVNLNEKKKVSP